MAKSPKLFIAIARAGALRLVGGKADLVGETPKTRQATTFPTAEQAETFARSFSHKGTRGRPAEVKVIEVSAQPTTIDVQG